MFEQRKELYKKIEKFTNSKVICFVTGDRQNMMIQIAGDALDHFVGHLDNIGKVKKISLILYSRGGDTLSGWSLVNLIKQFCDEFQVIIPSRALSTATLMSLGANSILMTKQATLGPIDPSINGPLNPQAPGGNPQNRIPISVESINGYFEFIKGLQVRNEGEISKLIIELTKHIHPVVLGNVYRSRSQIKMLGKKLLSNHFSEKKKIDKILDFLCSESGSHDYNIYRKEAKDELGLNVIKPNDDQYKLIKTLHDDYTEELLLLEPYDINLVLGSDSEKDYSVCRGLIESVEGESIKFMSEGKLTRKTVQTAQGAQEAINDRRLFEGWKK